VLELALALVVGLVLVMLIGTLVEPIVVPSGESLCKKTQCPPPIQSEVNPNTVAP